MDLDRILEQVSRGELSPEAAAALYAESGETAAAPAAAALSAEPAASPAEAVAALVRGKIARKLGGTDSPDEQHNFMELGIDSSTLLEMAMEIEEELSIELYPTTLFEHPNVKALAAYLVEHHDRACADYVARTSGRRPTGAGADALSGAHPESRSGAAVAAAPMAAAPIAATPAPASAVEATDVQTTSPQTTAAIELPRPSSGGKPDDIAVIGMAGRFAGSANLADFWTHLRTGSPLVTEIPRTRFDAARWFDQDRTAQDKIYCKWGSFIDGVDAFDPLFFNISPREAALMDPQLRLLLEVIYEAVDDAGCAQRIRGSNTGVFAGVCFRDYADEMARRGLPVDPHEGTGNVASMFSNRPSFFFDLNGPSVTVDTACSSSLVAVHLACKAIQNGECEAAIACGANLLLGVWHYQYFCSIGALSPTGRCHTFDARADGYVPGEGIASILLKPLARAQADGDRIHAVIRGSAVAHGGHTNSITAPSPASEANVILEAWKDARVDPATISYIEAHGTGTKLGDPIEIDGLSMAFARHTDQRRFCAVGSAKAHIGHTEGAAGIAGLIKVILSMQHRTIPAMPAFGRPNPYLRLDESPLYINTGEQPWTPNGGAPRRAGISSFGFGGTYAHVVAEEYPSEADAATASPTADDAPEIIVLSAKNEASLEEGARRLHAFLSQSLADRRTRVRVDDLACTLQDGREAMPVRAAFVTTTIEQVILRLEQLVAGAGVDLFLGKSSAAPVALDPAAARQAIVAGNLEQVASAWASGTEIDWRALRAEGRGRRIALPAYAFSRQRYWFEEDESAAHNGRAALAPATRGLHPLVDENVSTIDLMRFVKQLAPGEIAIADHLVLGRRVLPGVAHLEMARAAAQLAAGRPVTKLHDVFFMNPIVVGDEPAALAVEFFDNGLDLEYEIVGTDGEDTKIHSSGKVSFAPAAEPERLDLAAIRRRCSVRRSGDDIYAEDRPLGLDCHAYYQALVETHANATESLCTVSVPVVGKPDFERYTLDPGMMDGILHAPFGMVRAEGETRKLEVPYYIGEVEILDRLTPTCYAHATKGVNGSERSIDFTVADSDGRVLVKIRNFMSRAFTLAALAAGDEAVGFAPVWERAAAAADGTEPAGAVLVVTDDDGVYAALAAAAPPAQTLVRVRSGAAWARTADGFTLDLTARAQLDTLVATVRSEGPTLGGVLWLRDWAAPAADDAAAATTAVTAVLRVTQALLASAGPRVRLVYATASAEAAPQPVGAAVAGLARALAAETAAVEWRVVDVVTPAAALAAPAVWAELTQGSGPRRVRYANGARLEQRVAERALPPALETPLLRSGGTYLITGGAGGLGLRFAQYLLRRYQAQVMLCGRRPAAEVAPALAALQPLGGRVAYCAADVTDAVAMAAVVAQTRATFGPLHGVLHAAGVLADGYLASKSAAASARVLAPKVAGALVLDAVTRAEPLDWFVLFSSLAGSVGNAGQTDYAAGNAFLDELAVWREAQRAHGARAGVTVAVAWPLWAEGGMQLDAEAAATVRQTLGLVPLPTASGMGVFEPLLHEAQTTATPALGLAWGVGATLRTRLGLTRGTAAAAPAAPAPAPAPASASAPAAGPATVATPVLTALRQTLVQIAADVLKMRPADLAADADLAHYGFDSISIARFTRRIGEQLGLSITPAVFFEHKSIDSFATYLARDFASIVQAPVGAASTGDTSRETPVPEVLPAPDRRPRRRASMRAAAPDAPRLATVEPIAIVGMNGVFPQSPDLDTYWDHLASGRDLITEIPADRFDWRRYYGDPAREDNKTNSKWGGFMPAVDTFDAAFFSISPREAELMDPQQRLLLQTVWRTIEDAGYRPSALAGSKTGLFVGVSSFDYTELIDARHRAVEGYTSTGMAHSILANRVSYFFDFQGPSEPVDTACSSSLVALHRAVSAIRQGECEMAIAGGVNVLCSPKLYISFAKAGMLSPDGRCKTFDRAANGYVRGEGVGALLLKPLSRALADGDQIYGVIKGTAVNHGGHVHSLTVPNPNAQAELLVKAYEQASFDPSTITYIETHGTGTPLGDPIEVNGLKKAFAELAVRHSSTRRDTPHCGIGSVKSNLGHLEAAAGMASIVKVLLAMRHKRLPATLHVHELNPYIDLQNSPFFIVTESQPWNVPAAANGAPLPRRAGISSFGFGGANAHVAIEEYIAPERAAVAQGPAPQIVVLSAKQSAGIAAQVSQLRLFVEAHADEAAAPALADIAHTLQAGREPMAERVALVAATKRELLDKLAAIESGQDADVFRGNPAAAAQLSNIFGRDDDHFRYVDDLHAAGKLAKIAALWSAGVEIAWSRLGDTSQRRRVSLPAYPFARERHWIDTPECGAHTGGDTPAALHPLVDANESSIDRIVFRKRFTTADAVVHDHIVLGKPILPGMAHLEMVRAAAERAGRAKVARIEDVYWITPIALDGDALDVEIEFIVRDGETHFEVSSGEGDERATFSFGKVVYADETPVEEPSPIDLRALRTRCTTTTRVREDIYAQDASLGLELGDYYRTAMECAGDDTEAIGTIRRAVNSRGASDEFVLDPGMMDGALHCVLAVGAREGGERKLRVPYYLERLDIFDRLANECPVHVTNGDPESDGAFTYAIADPSGRVLARMTGFMSRAFTLAALAAGDEAVGFAPVWERAAAAADGTEPAGAVLVVTDDDGVYAALAAAAPPAQTLVRVRSGAAWARTADGFTLDLTARAQLDTLVATVRSEGPTLGGVLWLRDWAAPAADDAAAATTAVTAVLRVTQALLASAGPRVRLVYATASAEAAPQPVGAAVAGLARALAAETAAVEWRVVDVVTPAAALAAPAVWAELTQGSGPRRVRYANGARLEQRVAERALPPALETPLLRSGGTYLITGGAGGLGLRFAQYLLRRYQAQVMLCGRRPAAEVAPALAALQPLGGRVAYCAADVTDAVAMAAVVAQTRATFGPLHGVLHAAGVLADGYLASKSAAASARVLAPKVAGALVLDAVTRAEPLDWFVLFSSLAGSVGNAGQTDYAAGNAFLDELAVWREAQRAHGARAGVTVAVAWPLWAEGGMQLDAEAAATVRQTLGLVPLPTASGMGVFEPLLHEAQTTATPALGLAWGVGATLRTRLGLTRGTAAAAPAAPAPAPAPASASAPAAGPATVATPVLTALRQTLVQIAADVLKMRPADLAADADLAHYGFDSISIAQFTRRVGERYRVPLTPAVFFEHGTINSFGEHLVATHRAEVESAHADAIETRRVPAVATPTVQALPVRGPRRSRATARTATSNAAAADAPAAAVEDVAIIGMSGVFPQSADLESYWQHLEGGHDLISPVPDGRFDQTRHGGTPVAWCGGFMPDVDTFDAAFFNISPREATLMDPQQRLLLQTVWRTIEDAGYKPSQLASTNTGLFVGVASYDYGDLVDASGKDVEAYTVTGIAHSVLANRVSYFFNLRGPSEPINTACSSSLVAIHRAVTAIRQGECSMAFAGGVNVLCSPKLFLSFAKAGMLSPDGRCRTFASTANGYVRGEGVGALLLKPLSRALADGDHVYAVIKGSAVNHGGHVHSLTVPNPNAQADLLVDAYKRARVDIDTVTYIEAHGTGTALGDPIEINGLKKAFAALTPSGTTLAPATCGVGSVKTNVGHLEAAAGIAGVIKVLLAMRHGTLPASLHCHELNPYIDLSGSPLYIVDKTTPWKRKATADGGELPRRAGVSSFGFAGTNAHVVLEEFAPATRPVTASAPGERLLALSAKSADELRASAQQLLAFLQVHGDASDLPIDIADVAYTLLAGRDEMDVRLAVVAENAVQAIDALGAFANAEPHNRVFTGTARRPDATDAAGAAVDADAVRDLVRNRGLAAAAARWVGQRGVDLAGLFDASGRRVALPTYPFGGKRYWIASVAESAAAVVSGPIVDRVVAAGGAAQSRTALSSADSLVADHVVNGAATLPGVVYLEMALQTAAAAERQAVRRLRNIIWSHPFAVGPDARELRVDVHPRAGALQFTAVSGDSAGETVHCRGELISGEPASTGHAVPQVDTEAVSARCSRHLPQPAVYAAFSRRGLVYGPTYQGIARLQASDDEAFATIAAAPSSAPAGCTLPPFVCDAALQATMAFLPEHDRDRVLVPFALGDLEILGSIDRTRYVHVTKTDLDLERGSATFDINLLDETGRLTARLRDFNARAFGASRQAPAAAADLDDAAVEALLQAVATGELSIEDAGSRLPF